MLTKIKTNQKLIFVAAVLLVLLVLSTVLASSQTLFAGEARLLVAINSWADALKIPMLGITYAGSELAIFFFLALLIAKNRRALAVRLVTLIGATYIIGRVVKHVIARPRPAGLISDVIVRQTESGYGFPSLHVAITTVMAVTLCRFLPKSVRWQLAAIWILLVALSRVYLGVHAPLDVVGGFALGGLIALVPDFLQVFYDKPTVKSSAQK